MRTLLVATAIILSVSAATAQEMVPTKSGAVQDANDRALPSKSLVEQLKAAGELKDEPKQLEAPAPKLGATTSPAPAAPPAQTAAPAPATPAPAQTAAPAQSLPPDKVQMLPRPAETNTVEAKPAETKPAETKAVETKPAETKAVEETKPVKSKPARVATATRPAKKKVRNIELDERRARNIAAKYGISW